MDCEVRSARSLKGFFILYIMITKFYSNDFSEYETIIELSREDNCLMVEVEHQNPSSSQEIHKVLLDEDKLFSLIGQLLRIQSEIKK